MSRFQALLEDAIASGIKAKDIAKEAEVNEGLISKYRKGERYPSLLTIQKLAPILHVSQEELLKTIIEDMKERKE